MIYFTPIWDVLVLQGEQERALIRLSTCSRCPVFPIRQAVPVGLARALDRCWAHWAQFFMHKSLYFDISIVSKHIASCSMCLGRWEWVDGNRWVWMLYPFWGASTLSYLR